MGERIIDTTERDNLLNELNAARNIVNGPAAPYFLLNDENFPNLSKYAPETLSLLRDMGKVSFESDKDKVNFAMENPEIWGWHNQQEREVLISAALIGRGAEALDKLKREHGDRINRGTMPF